MIIKKSFHVTFYIIWTQVNISKGISEIFDLVLSPIICCPIYCRYKKVQSHQCFCHLFDAKKKNV